ncbi:ribonuclease III [Candidatus Saccharibacteria bacterium]|nr:ribonuclease III [Candidatus Saccharibacteria bacterium]
MPKPKSVPPGITREKLSAETIHDYQAFSKDRLGFTFKEPRYIITALTHRSYVNEHKSSGSEHNERLEFLGDAVLELVVTDYLYQNFTEPEGILTNYRSALVKTESIYNAGERLNYAHLLRVSRGERRTTPKPVMIADAFEAMIGAIYLDQGLGVAIKFIEKNIITDMLEVLRTGSWREPKSRLQELAQATDQSLPQYKLVKTEGPDHARTYYVSVSVGGRRLGRGQGSSKQVAEQKAAEEAVHHFLADNKRKWYK